MSIPRPEDVPAKIRGGCSRVAREPVLPRFRLCPVQSFEASRLHKPHHSPRSASTTVGLNLFSSGSRRSLASISCNVTPPPSA